MDVRLISIATAVSLLFVGSTLAEARVVVLAGPPVVREARNTTAVGQTKPPAPLTGEASSNDAGQASTAAPISDEELKNNIKIAQEKQRARDRSSNDLMTRWEFAICIGCNQFAKPFRRVWTNPLRVLAGIPATEDDKRQARLNIRWTSLIVSQ